MFYLAFVMPIALVVVHPFTGFRRVKEGRVAVKASVLCVESWKEVDQTNRSMRDTLPVTGSA